MAGVLEKQLALAIDRRIAVFKPKNELGAVLEDEMSLRSMAYIISEILQPCCCMLCNKNRLEELLSMTESCCGNQELIRRLALLVYDDLARCNGLG